MTQGIGSQKKAPPKNVASALSYVRRARNPPSNGKNATPKAMKAREKTRKNLGDEEQARDPPPNATK
jgi:hypothetical protein